MLYPNQIMLDVPAPPVINLVVPIYLIRQMIIGYLQEENYAGVDAIVQMIHFAGYQPKDLGIPTQTILGMPVVI